MIQFIAGSIVLLAFVCVIYPIFIVSSKCSREEEKDESDNEE